MVFTEKHFVYDGVYSRQFNLIIAHIDTEKINKLCGDVETQTFFNRNTREKYIIGQKYDDSALEIDIEFISETPLSKTEQRTVKKWLFNKNEYKKLYIDKFDDEEIEKINGELKQCYVNCIFTSPEIIEFDNVYGYKAKMQLSSPFAFQDEIVIEKENDNAGYSESNSHMYVKVDVDTDIDGYIYPIITANRYIYPPTSEMADALSTVIGNYKIKNAEQPISDENSEIYSDFIYSLHKSADTAQEPAINKIIDRDECSIIGKTIDGITMRYILNSQNDIAEKECSLYSLENKTLFASVKDGKFIKLYNGENYLRFDKSIRSVKIKYQNVRYIR